MIVVDDLRLAAMSENVTVLYSMESDEYIPIISVNNC